MSTEETKIIRETLDHIRNVQKLIAKLQTILTTKLMSHDRTKLEEDELPYFIKYTPMLAGTTYGSDDYKGLLKQLKPALDHHYLHNSHHPEHFVNGIDGMNLIDLLELICDWHAAYQRHNDGSMDNSFKVNEKRFDISPQLMSILRNTVKLLD